MEKFYNEDLTPIEMAHLIPKSIKFIPNEEMLKILIDRIKEIKQEKDIDEFIWKDYRSVIRRDGTKAYSPFKHENTFK
jgi:hypothetical protein